MTELKTDTPCLARLLQLIDGEYPSDGAFEAALSLPPKTVSNWRLGRSHSYMKLLPALCDLFAVSPADLLAVAPTAGGDLSAEEIAIVTKLREARTLTPERRAALFTTVEQVISLYLSDAESKSPQTAKRGRPRKNP